MKGECGVVFPKRTDQDLGQSRVLVCRWAGRYDDGRREGWVEGGGEVLAGLETVKTGRTEEKRGEGEEEEKEAETETEEKSFEGERKGTNWGDGDRRLFYILASAVPDSQPITDCSGSLGAKGDSDFVSNLTVLSWN